MDEEDDDESDSVAVPVVDGNANSKGGALGMNGIDD
jgi:hypothetical protein